MTALPVPPVAPRTSSLMDAPLNVRYQRRPSPPPFRDRPSLEWRRRQVGQLLGIGHDVDRADASIVHLDREHRLRSALDVAHDARLAVDLDDPLKRIQRLELREPEHA